MEKKRVVILGGNYVLFQGDEKVYKSIINSNINMHPSDYKKSLDDFSFFNYLTSVDKYFKLNENHFNDCLLK